MSDDDDISLFLKKCLNVLLVANPKGTALGAMLGLVVYAVVDAIQVDLSNPLTKILSRLGAWVYFLTGVAVFNLPVYFQEDSVPKSVISLLDQIDEMEKSGKISKAQARLKRGELLTKLIAATSVAESIPKLAGQENETDSA